MGVFLTVVQCAYGVGCWDGERVLCECCVSIVSVLCGCGVSVV